MAEEYDSYELADAPLLGEGTVTINTASFGYDAQYAGGEQLCLVLEGNVVVADGESHEWRKLYSVGKGWEAVDHGAKCQAADGRPRKFQKTSKFGFWLAGAIASGAADVLRKRGQANEAKIWEGLVFEVVGQEHDFGGEIGKKANLVPVKFLGEAGKGTSSAATATASTATPTAAPTNGAIPAALKAKLKKLAKECESHDAFIDRAFVEVDGVDGNPAAESLVADSPSFYEEARA